MNAHSPENSADSPSSSGGLCPTCHRPFHDEGSGHSPAFMDSEYFRLLSSINSDLSPDNQSASRDVLRGDISETDDERPPGSLPRSAFNQGYFEQ